MNMFKKNGGFTLVELVVVIAILAILAGVAVPAYSGYIQKANDAAVVSELAALQTAAQSACAMNGKALDKQGFVWNLSDKTVVKNISGAVMQDVATPLWSFEYMGYSINTYAKHSQIISDNTSYIWVVLMQLSSLLVLEFIISKFSFSLLRSSLLIVSPFEFTYFYKL